MIHFNKKKILITGATGGIGNALVKKFIDLKGSVKILIDSTLTGSEEE